MKTRAVKTEELETRIGVFEILLGAATPTLEDQEEEEDVEVGQSLSTNSSSDIIKAEEGYDVYEIPMFGGPAQFVKNVRTLKEADQLVSSFT